MNRRKKPFNPFYALLLIAGTAFCITACAYGVNAVRDVHGGSFGGSSESRESPGAKAFGEFIDRYGTALIVGQLGVLAVATFAAIGTDDYWARRFERKQSATLTDTQTTDPGERL